MDDVIMDDHGVMTDEDMATVLDVELGTTNFSFALNYAYKRQNQQSMDEIGRHDAGEDPAHPAGQTRMMRNIIILVAVTLVLLAVAVIAVVTSNTLPQRPNRVNSTVPSAIPSTFPTTLLLSSSESLIQLL
jgi:hypothetical protein